MVETCNVLGKQLGKTELFLLNLVSNMLKHVSNVLFRVRNVK